MSRGQNYFAVTADDAHEYVEIDFEETQETLKFPNLAGNTVSEGILCYSIEFIGKGGEILQNTEGTSATYILNNKELYLRCRATFCQRIAENKYEKLNAWTQPVFQK